jgi:hypothetical protein
MRPLHKNAIRLGLLALAVAGVSSLASSQSLLGIDGSGTPGAPVVHEFTGPPGGPCLYPNGPLLRSFPAIGGVVCPGLQPFPLPFDGDVAINSITDVVYAGDVFQIARYSSSGAFIDSFPSPLAITGLGMDPFGPLLWITDGAFYGAVVPPPVHGCLFGPPPFAVGPFPVPAGPGFFTGPMTDIAYDTANGTLWGCDLTGVVGNFLIGPIPAAGPFGFFPVAPGPCPALMPALTGIALDNSFPGSGTFYVTDGFEIAYMLPGGVLAPPTFYTPVPCYPVPTQGISGLAFVERAVTYGVGTDTLGNPPPTIGSIGQTIPGNPGFTVTLDRAVPGSVATLFASTGVQCPPLPVVGLNLYISLAPLFNLGTVPVAANGKAFQNVPLIASMKPGFAMYMQWLVVTPMGSLQATEGLGFTIGLY